MLMRADARAITLRLLFAASATLPLRYMPILPRFICCHAVMLLMARAVAERAAIHADDAARCCWQRSARAARWRVVTRLI